MPTVLTVEYISWNQNSHVRVNSWSCAPIEAKVTKNLLATFQMAAGYRDLPVMFVIASCTVISKLFTTMQLLAFFLSVTLARRLSLEGPY